MSRFSLLAWVLLAGSVAACQAPAAEKAETSGADRLPGRKLAADTLTQPVVAAKNYPYSIPPVNQVPQEPALQAFVQKILRACAARRPADLLALVDDSVAVSNGGGIYGKPGFVTEFLNNPQPGSGFDRLREVIQFGGTVEHGSAERLIAAFPYFQDGALYKGRLAHVELDPFISYVGTVPGLVVYRRPTHRSRQVAQLDYPVLFTGYDAPDLGGDWLRVVAVDSSFQGYVEAKNLYCMAAMTLTIVKKKGQFKITSVVPYD